MNLLVFVVYMWAAPNPHHPLERIRVPPALSLVAYVEAARYDHTPYPVAPEELIAILLHEHDDRAPDRHDSKGDRGASLGLYQLTAEERREYNEAHGTAHKGADLFDPHVNTAVAAYAFHDHKETHATEDRCRGKNHMWVAHQKCTFAARESCVTSDRERTIRILSRWRRRAFWR